jgi:hypothetical protein
MALTYSIDLIALTALTAFDAPKGDLYIAGRVAF